jgi:GNAT superfamily N-acetyltransferase
MGIEITSEPATSLDEWADVSPAFDVCTVFDVSMNGRVPAQFCLSERRLPSPYCKDYDLIAANSPRLWAQRFDVSSWGLFAARRSWTCVGRAAVLASHSNVEMLESRSDLAVLWDIRVAASLRGRGIGRALFRAVEAWARARNCQQLKIETQNINVPGCRFYQRQGCTLAAANHHAYPDFPDEVQLLWFKNLS